MDEASIKVHGLRSVDLEDAPELEVAIDPLLAAMAGAIPVVHFAEVERRFLARHCAGRACACATRWSTRACSARSGCTSATAPGCSG